MSDNKQLEIFNAFGNTEINCFSCTKVLPQNTPKVEEKHLCGACLKLYINNLEVVHTIVLPQTST